MQMKWIRLNSSRPCLFLALTGGTDAEEFQLMGDRCKAVPAGDLGFQLPDRDVSELHDAGAYSAHQVMMMAVVALQQQLEPGNPIPQFESFHHAHILEQ